MRPSTTLVLPVRARLAMAAQMPPASVMPDIPSPWPIIPVGKSTPVTSMVDWASVPRPHQVIPS